MSCQGDSGRRCSTIGSNDRRLLGTSCDILRAFAAHQPKLSMLFTFLAFFQLHRQSLSSTRAPSEILHCHDGGSEDRSLLIIRYECLEKLPIFGANVNRSQEHYG